MNIWINYKDGITIIGITRFIMNWCSNHSIRSRFNSWIMYVTEELCHKVYGRLKQQLFEDLPDSIVELGPGTGANFRYYRQGTLVTAIEPNPFMHKRLRRNAEHYGINIEIWESEAEYITLANQSTDAVVATLVLCSVNQTQVLNQIYRILRPGGRFLFLEHLAASNGSVLRCFQEKVRRPWQWYFQGCNLTPETDTILQEAKFSKIELEYFVLKGLLSISPTRNHIIGIASK